MVGGSWPPARHAHFILHGSANETFVRSFIWIALKAKIRMRTQTTTKCVKCQRTVTRPLPTGPLRLSRSLSLPRRTLGTLFAYWVHWLLQWARCNSSEPPQQQEEARAFAICNLIFQ